MENNHFHPSVPSEKCIKIPRQINKDVPRSLDKKKCFSTKPVTGYGSGHGSGYGGGSSGGGGYGGGGGGGGGGYSAPVYHDTSRYSSSSPPSYSPSHSSSSSGSYSSPHSSSPSGSYSSPHSSSGYEQKRSVSAESQRVIIL